MVKSIAQQHCAHNTITAELSDSARAKNFSLRISPARFPVRGCIQRQFERIREAEWGMARWASATALGQGKGPWIKLGKPVD